VPSPQQQPTSDDGSGDLPAKLIAFYLPQFHPIPENDLWWGEGFTEWTNVTRARPQFTGHYQPQLPTELGFYDLRDPEVLERQADLARHFGIHGFCFHYYWFNGRRVLERPLDEFLARSHPELPFCCCWANENWTRRWDGLDDEILLRQEYAGDWAERFIRDLLPTLVEDRHIRVDGAPLLLVYRIDELPDAPRVAELWREIAQREAGLELHLAAVQSFGIGDPRPYGFDAAVEFPPHPFGRQRPLALKRSRPEVRRLRRGFRGTLENYEEIALQMRGKQLPEYRWYRGLMPSWDNTARRGAHAYIAVGSSPDVYRRWLGELTLHALARSDVQEPLLFVNAWNEWAEGTHLEPDDRFGRRWLQATFAGLQDGLQRHAAAQEVVNASTADAARTA
jgi:lipopolysaccharide biosynthesis protein